MWRADSLEKSNHLLILRLSTVILEPKKIKSDAGKDWGHEEKRVTEDEMVVWYHLSKLQEIVKDREVCHDAFTGLQRVGHDLANEQQQKGNVFKLNFWITRSKDFLNVFVIIIFKRKKNKGEKAKKKIRKFSESGGY